MDIQTFFSALLAIVVIDLVLAGDNAIVIALAARSLPAPLRRRAVVWGAVGAIVVRSAMTAAVVWLLQVPGLLLAGGLMLVWIAYRLLVPADAKDGASQAAAGTFWGAMRTIVIADAVMGLDNVLAVAGAAHGSYLLVVLGLVISVPIVVWGSALVLKVVDRFPLVIYLGAAVLAWTAAAMITREPLLAPWLQQLRLLGPLVYALVPLVLWAGFVGNRRQRAARDGAPAAVPPAAASAGNVAGVDTAARAADATARIAQPTIDVLVPVDGSDNALRAVGHVIAQHQRHRDLQVQLLNVQPRLPLHIARLLRRSDRHGWQRARAEAALQGARAALERAGVPHRSHHAVGDRALEICRHARALGVQRIVMGTARKNSLSRMLEHSVTNRVLEATPVAVELVAGDAVSPWERWGLPLGALGAAGSLLVMALD